MSAGKKGRSARRLRKCRECNGTGYWFAPEQVEGIAENEYDFKKNNGERGVAVLNWEPLDAEQRFSLAHEFEGIDEEMNAFAPCPACDGKGKASALRSRR